MHFYIKIKPSFFPVAGFGSIRPAPTTGSDDAAAQRSHLATLQTHGQRAEEGELLSFWLLVGAFRKKLILT